MYPDLIKTTFTIPGFGPLEIPSYFTGLTLGYALAIILLWRWGKRAKVDPDGMLDLGILMVVGGILGSRILSVIADGHFWDYIHLCTDPMQVDWPISKGSCMSERYSGIWDPIKRVCHPDYRDCLSWIKFWRGGLAFYGGLIVASAAGFVFLKVKKLPVLRVVDITGCLIPLGLAWGRIGCFFNGCCFGSVTDSWLGVVFPKSSQASFQQFRSGLLESPHMPSLPVYPTQLFEAAFSFLIALFCCQYMERYKQFKGQTFLVFAMLYAVMRFLEEFLRRDDRGELLGMSTSQLIALFTVAAGAVFYTLALRRHRRRQAA